ncbi:CueP family metal-binding protein [Paenibacillus massiliensis]|uniref:CueP family metal-binding protein n=1 Tax=Paenibacillus massiliensis TaxID=225917 RepID=UPI0003620076|nr:CueP family metal-binding protein [Paenibacillus massiliensis]
MRKGISIVVGLVVIAVGTYLFIGGPQQKEASTTSVVTGDIKSFVQQISTGQVDAQSASITSHQLTVTDSKEHTQTYAVDGDEFFVSIAPYIQQTHPCEIHSLTGCEGELQDQEFMISIEDESGNTVMNRDVVKSQSNGFIDLWLPRDQTYHITIEHEGKTSEADISTREGDNTCITTMQLI